MQKIISITGSTGFVGSNLKKYFLKLGYHVNCLVREVPILVEENVSYFLYQLERPLSETDFPAASITFHCAFVQYSNTRKNAAEINIYGTKNLIAMCRIKSVKMVFFSSLSAHSAAESNYGRNKLYLETLFDLRKDLILKLGLVVGQGGIFASMEQTIRKSKILPLIDGGTQSVYIVDIEDLMTICKISSENDIVGKFTIGKVLPVTLKKLYLLMGQKINRKNYFVPVPSTFLMIVLKLAERLGLKLPFGTENLSGLKKSKVWDTGEGMELFRGHEDSSSLTEYMKVEG